MGSVNSVKLIQMILLVVMSAPFLAQAAVGSTSVPRVNTKIEGTDIEVLADMVLKREKLTDYDYLNEVESNSHLTLEYGLNCDEQLNESFEVVYVCDDRKFLVFAKKPGGKLLFVKVR